MKMRKWFTTLVLIAAIVGGVVGAGAHQGEGSCPLGNVPDCCRKARSSSKAPEVAMARLCCNLNCSEPGNSGESISLRFSSPQGSTPLPAEIPRPMMLEPVPLNRQRQSSNLPDSNPKYIQHLALLI
jgi:hypothetical protein